MLPIADSTAAAAAAAAAGQVCQLLLKLLLVLLLLLRIELRRLWIFPFIFLHACDGTVITVVPDL
jgi:hypothetical protein